MARSAAESREKVHHLESMQASLLSERDQLQKQVWFAAKQLRLVLMELQTKHP